MAKDDDYEALDAMHAMMRADEMSKDEKLMKRMRKHAAEYAAEMRERSERAGRLAKAGHISEKQMAKLKKNKNLASGNEGDDGKPSRTMAGATYK